MIIGIDLGTTNSAVAVWRNGGAELVPNALGDVLTPSVVARDDRGRLVVGRAAHDRRATRANDTAAIFKRYMGLQRTTTLGDRSFLPEELSALVLRSLKADAEAHLGEAVTEAVITVPAYFNDRQRKATRRAGELAGLKVERLLNEPTAAALAYGIHQRDDHSRFLVFDLGGGTFDVSILEIFEGVIEVRATAGDNHLGGEDFNAVIVADLLARWPALAADRDEATLAARLTAAAERARRGLTDGPVGEARLVWRDNAFDYDLDNDRFEALAKPLVERLREPVLRSLRDSTLRPDELNEIILVGGATRMPLVRRAVTRMFGRFPNVAMHPDHAVAIGAAIQAGLKARDAALREVVLTDVCPFSLGVETSERLPSGELRQGLFSPILERNTTVPASRARTFSTVVDNQERVSFPIYQGESLHVRDNISLGKVDIPVPRRPAGEPQIECRFTYDINGLLEVDLFVPETGERRDLVIVGEGDLTPQEVEVRRRALAELKIHPRDGAANRAATARAERCFEAYLGETRDYVARLIQRFEAVLDTQDPRAAEVARRALVEALDELEGGTPP